MGRDDISTGYIIFSIRGYGSAALADMTPKSPTGAMGPATHAEMTPNVTG